MPHVRVVAPPVPAKTLSWVVEKAPPELLAIVGIKQTGETAKAGAADAMGQRGRGPSHPKGKRAP